MAENKWHINWKVEFGWAVLVAVCIRCDRDRPCGEWASAFGIHLKFRPEPDKSR